MATGTTRREETGSRLSGASRPTLSPVVGVQGVQRAAQIAVQQREPSILDGITKFVGGRIAAAAAERNEKAMLEGAIKYQQGKTTKELGANPWELEGYQVLEAENTAASIMEAQRAEIASSGYALSSDEYRMQQSSRLEEMIKDKDPRVQRLIREKMVNQSAVLVREQTQANLQYKEGQNYKAMVTGIDLMSRDPTAVDDLVSFARGEGAGAALSPERREAALVEGLRSALNNKNPQAYAVLMQSGIIDELPVAQRDAIRFAKQEYDNRIKSEYDAELFQTMKQYDQKVANGDFANPMEAVEALAGIYEKYEVDMTTAEASSVYLDSREGQITAARADNAEIELKIIEGDYIGAAQQFREAFAKVESGGNYQALGPVMKKGAYNGDRAYGKYQVMGRNIPEWTEKHYGARLTPEQFLGNPAAQDAVFDGEIAGYIKKHGNVSDAASMWFSGRPMAEAGNASDGYNTVPQYVAKINAALGQNFTPSERLTRAQKELTAAKDRINLPAYEEFAWQRNDVDEQFKSGDLSRTDWLNQRRALYSEYNQKREQSDVTQEIAIATQATQQAAEAMGAQVKDAFDQAMLPARVEYQAVATNPNATYQEKMTALQAFDSRRQEVAQELGVPLEDQNNSSHRNFMVEQFKSATAQEFDRTQKQTAAQQAASVGALGDPSMADPKTAKKMYDAKLAEVQAEAAKQPRTDQDPMEQADNYIQDAMLDWSIESGYFPAETSALFNSVLTGNVVDRDGAPLPEAVDAVTQYARVKDRNPAMASRLVTNPAARERAETAIEMAGGVNGNMQAAIKRLGMALPMVTGAQPVDLWLNSEETQRTIADTSRSYARGSDSILGMLTQSLNPLSGWDWNDPSGSAGRALWSVNTTNPRTVTPAMLEQFENALSTEMGNVYKELGGQVSQDIVARRANARLKDRMAVLNGHPFVPQTGINMTEATFGTRSPDYNDPALVDEAVQNWLAEVATPAGMVREDAGVRGFWNNKRPGLDALSIADDFGIDYQPFNVEKLTNSDGTQETVLNVRVTYRPTGWDVVNPFSSTPDEEVSQVIQVPLSEAGRLLLNKKANKE